jgi:hypothetical protein
MAPNIVAEILKAAREKYGSTANRETKLGDEYLEFCETVRQRCRRHPKPSEVGPLTTVGALINLLSDPSS